MAEAKPEIIAGAIFERDHPFTWVVEGSGPDAVERWRPGAWNIDNTADDTLASCTALGRVKYTVISTHRPPGHEERVFFKREFMTPDGTRYAPGRLINSITRKFRKDIAAFPFAFDVEQPDYSEAFNGFSEAEACAPVERAEGSE